MTNKDKTTILVVDDDQDILQTVKGNLELDGYEPVLAPSAERAQTIWERGGIDLMPEMGTRPVNKYLPPRPKDVPSDAALNGDNTEPKGFLAWLDKALEAI